MAEISRPLTVERATLAARIRAGLKMHGGLAGIFAVFALLAWVVFNWTETVRRILRYYNPLPAWDYWRTADFLRAYEAFDVSILWRQHNEHRIVFPEIVFAADYLLFHGRQLLPLAISFLCYAGSWGVLAWAFWSIQSLTKPLRALGILLAGVIIGWQGSAIVLADPFLLQWTLLEFAVLLAFVSLVRLSETGISRYLAAVICCAEVATYSSGNGLLLWPLLIGIALLLSIGKRRVITLMAAGFVSIAVYFIGYKFTGTLSIAKLLLHPIYLTGFIGAYLSMPFGALKSPTFGVWLGIGALFVVILLAITAFRRHVMTSRPGVVLFGFYAFVLLTALLTAAGRLEPSDPTFSAAKPARYVTEPLIAWGAFCMLSLWLCARSQALRPRIAIGCLLAVFLLIAFPKFRWWLQGASAAHANEQMASLAIGLGIEDPGVILNIFPDPASVSIWTADLRAYDVSVFYHGRSKWFGKEARRFAPLPTSVIPGEITYTYPVVGGVEIGGWFDDSQIRGGTGWVLLANEEEKIVGFGRRLPAGYPSALDNSRTPPTLGWVGFVNSRYPVKQLTAYVINKRGLLPFEASVAIPSLQVTAWKRSSVAVHGVNWEKDGSWKVNELPPGEPFGPGPAVFYSSWAGSDANTGRIVSSVFDAPASGCLILPVLQGPRAGGLAADIVNAENGRVLSSIPFQNAVKTWAFWRLPVGGSVRKLRIVAEDRGTNWGEWLAVGNPLLCD